MCVHMCWQDASTDLYPPVGPNKPHIDLGTLMTVTSKPKRVLRTTNAYFYWVTREQGSFDWFKGVMNEIAELDQRVHSTNWPFVLFEVWLMFPFGGLLTVYPLLHSRISSRCTTTSLVFMRKGMLGQRSSPCFKLWTMPRMVLTLSLGLK
jgi:hypothetical protein